MFAPKSYQRSTIAVAVLLLVQAGCADGPGFQLRKWSPMAQSEWAKDRAKSVVFSQRQAEAVQLRAQLPRMSDSEQQHWVEVIDKMVVDETSPEMRRESILTLEKVIRRPDAAKTVIRLSQDKTSKVRLAAAKALRNSEQPKATQTLLAMAQSDADKDVRMKAVESLGNHRSDDVKQFLTKTLEDRSPIVQHQTMLALRNLTGKDLELDAEQWKRYMAGEDVQSKTPTLAESIQSYWPLKR